MKVSTIVYACAAVVAVGGGIALAQTSARAEENQPVRGRSVCETKRCDVSEPRGEDLDKYEQMGRRLRICAPGYSWQYGCLKWGEAGPGQLFGACLVNGYGCFRIPGPIQ